MRKRGEATTVPKATSMRSVTRSLITESPLRPASSVSDTDDGDEDEA